MNVRERDTNPLVSVIVPVYKVENYLRKCVESVLLQPSDDYEIILVDDGSPDNCPAICDEFARRYDCIKVVHQKNGGLSDARNTGVLQAQGEYLMFLDSDDMLIENSLPEIETAIRDSHPDVLIGRFVLFPDLETDADDFWDSSLMVSRNPKRIKEYLFTNSSRFWWVAWRNIVRRTFFLSNDLLFMKGILHEDEEWTPRLYWLAETYYYADTPFYFYRKRGGSITSAVKFHHVKSLCLIVESLGRFMDKYPDSRVFVAKRQFELARVVYSKMRFLTNAEIGVLMHEFDNRPIIGMIKQLFFFPFLSLILDTKNHFVFEQSLRRVKYFISSVMKRLQLKLTFLQRAIGRYRLFRRSVLTSRSNHKKSIFLVATPLHSNLGDHAIALAEHQFFRDYFPEYCVHEISDREILRALRFYKKSVAPEDILCVTGGGFMGTLWIIEEVAIRKVIEAFPNNPVMILPQTVYYGDSPEERKELEISQKKYRKHDSLSIFARERSSCEYLKKHFERASVRLAPDMALYLTPGPFSGLRKGVAVCLRDDKESVLENAVKKQALFTVSRCCPSEVVTSIDTMAEKGVNPTERENALNRKWREFASRRLVVTDRLHGMIFAVITGTPVVAINNLSKKVEGVYEWVKALEYVRFINCVGELESAVRSLDLNKAYVYSNEPLRKCFDVGTDNS
jgi:exopolysaccharide biosynthesis predicted pyruvyltransferase EpsI/glycosyltransferase involved in cell wall biosynthesis